MSRAKCLTDLQNIGKKLASRLNEVGIHSEDDLHQVGAAGAHRLIKK
jgi:predicted flap endonuclease-1-like 5' DNA nuclease